MKILSPCSSKISAWQILYFTGPAHAGFRLVQELTEEGEAGSHVEIAVESSTALQWLREYPFDVVLVGHHPPSLNALEFIRIARPTSPARQAWIIVTANADSEFFHEFHHEQLAEIDDIVDLRTSSLADLQWRISRAIQRSEMLAAHRALLGQLKRRGSQERDLALRQVATSFGSSHHADLPPVSAKGEFATLSREEYDTLLRRAVLEGFQRLGTDIDQLVQDCLHHKITAEEVVQHHAAVVRDVINNTNPEGVRHLTTRADALLIEILRRLCDASLHGRPFP